MIIGSEMRRNYWIIYTVTSVITSFCGEATSSAVIDNFANFSSVDGHKDLCYHVMGLTDKFSCNDKLDDVLSAQESVSASAFSSEEMMSCTFE